MNLNDTGMIAILIVLLVVLMGVNFYMGRRKLEKSPLGKVVSVLTDIRHNQRVVDNFSFSWRATKRLKSGAWRRNSYKIDFMPRDLLGAMDKLFDMVNDINQRIDMAKKYKSDSYMAGVEVDKLKVPQDKIAEELTEWVQANMQNPAYAPKQRRGLFR